MMHNYSVLPCDYNLNLYRKAYNIPPQIGMSIVCLIIITNHTENLSVSSCCLWFAGKITAGRVLYNYCT